MLHIGNIYVLDNTNPTYVLVNPLKHMFYFISLVMYM